MTSLGKDPRWYSLRSIRQSTAADKLHMPEVFMRASGCWKGDALEIYRKDRLPEVQARFAEALGSQSLRSISAKVHPTPSLNTTSEPRPT